MYKKEDGVDDQIFTFQGIKKFVTKGTYIFVVMSEDEDAIWTFTSLALPIFDFEKTQIFEVETAGIAEVICEEKKDGFYFRVNGVKAKQIYNFSYIEDEVQ